jgi:rRNA maturation RNase YbeY
VKSPRAAKPVLRQLEVGDAARTRAFCGPVNRNLLLLENTFGVKAECSGGSLSIVAEDEESAEAALSTAREMVARLEQGLSLEEADVRALVGFARRAAMHGKSISMPGRRQPIEARTPNQSRYLEHLLSEDHDLVFATGSAGTGKTFLATAVAVAALLNDRVRRIVVTRPAIEAGERLGFLPGDLTEKVDPYLQPIWDALRTLLGEQKLQRFREMGQIEVAPLAFMRGRTLSDAFVIVDEAQNATRLQMKMVLTRLGEGSRMVVTGDPTQVDLPRISDSGLAHAINLLEDERRIAVIRFGPEDVVRHPLVGRIVAAYDREQAMERSAAPSMPAPQSSSASAMEDIEVEVEVTAPEWKQQRADVTEIVRDAIFATLDDEGAIGHVSVRLTDDAEMQTLNRAWREKDKPTNILSFPAPEMAMPHLGDLALGVGIVSKEAHEQGKAFADHLTHLIVHGVLHLCGYDHDGDEDEAEEMEQRERDILATMGIADPYEDRADARGDA